MQIILIPTDFSDNALHAIHHALKLFKLERANFYFLHAYADEVYELSKSGTRDSLKQRRKEVRKKTDTSLDQLLSELEEEFPNPKHSYQVVSAFESLVDAVNDFVDQVDIDLIVMGTKGLTSDKRTTLGSHTVQVLKYVKCPVLAIPEEYAYQPPKKILFPTDYMLPFKRRELKLLNELAGSFKSEIDCLYISALKKLSFRQEDNKLFLQNTLSSAFLFFKQCEGEDRVQIILEHIAKDHIDMLVMVNSRHSLLENMLYRSTVDQIGLTVSVPFLVMQNLPR
ncbi:universal stress protein [Flavobacteriaceae bacterium 3-367]